MPILFSLTQWIMMLTAAFIIGMGKAGLKGVDMLSVTMMVLVFGGKASTGIVLPLLCMGDIAAVIYYHRHAQWNHFYKLTPWMIVGILMGVYLGKDLNEAVFRKIMAVIILITIFIILWMEYRKNKSVPSSPLFVIGTGISAGFTTMLGNLAGAFSNLYFLAMRMEKNDFIGTAAWIFLFMNLFKLPFQIFFWHNINEESIKIDGMLVPLLALGFWSGLRIVGKIRDEHYRKLIILLTLIGSITMLLKR